jgi:hypothetical protein
VVVPGEEAYGVLWWTIWLTERDVLSD